MPFYFTLHDFYFRRFESDLDRLEELFRELELRDDRDEDLELSERLDSFELDLLFDEDPLEDPLDDLLEELSLPDCGLLGLIATSGLV